MTAAMARVHIKVRRTSRSSWIGLAAAVPLLVILADLPFLVGRGTQQSLVTLFALIVLGTMWNLLAGYGGMVSIGQQAYIGVGAYGLVYIADTLGLNPLLAVPLAAVLAGLVSLPISFLVFRLAGGYFAIATWVVAEVLKLGVSQVDRLGGGSGVSLRAYRDFVPDVRIAVVYWLSLGAAVAAVAVTYLLMRSKLGLGFTAIRDDMAAAASLGVGVTRARRIVFVVAGAGSGLAGAMIASNSLRIQPDSMFSVQYSAFMLFIVVIGGIGSIEGPIVGAVLFYVLQQWLADLGTWYLIVLGLVAIVVVLFLPGGVWGLLSGQGRIRFFPVGYRLISPSDAGKTPAQAVTVGRGVKSAS
uniref:branched-chain amino acid ABC transporter permease n=1 Tax=Nonomuraea bangladeshensis TaxID=404385 RepID=UPI003F499BDF